MAGSQEARERRHEGTSTELAAMQRLLAIGRTKGLDMLRTPDKAKMVQVRADLANFGRAALPEHSGTLTVILSDRGGIVPAWTSPDQEGGIEVHICKWYVQMSSAAEILGMITHELGVHSLANLEMTSAERQNETVLLALGHVDPENRVNLASHSGPADPREADHVAVAMDRGGVAANASARTRRYVATLLRMGDAVRASGRAEEQIQAELVDLLKTFLFDIARLMATDDAGPFTMMWRAGDIARLFNWYRTTVVDRHGDEHGWLRNVNVNASEWGIRGWLLGKLAKYAAVRARNVAGGLIGAAGRGLAAAGRGLRAVGRGIGALFGRRRAGYSRVRQD